jgi:hypothetical protein
MRKIILIGTYLIFTSSAFATYGFKDCSRSNIDTLFDYTEESHKEIKDWKSELSKDKYKKLSFIHRSKIKVARGVLNCIEKKLDKMTYKCNGIKSSHKNSASTLPVLGKIVKLSADFFDYSRSRSIGIIIHEASHKCGTTDAAYFNNTIPYSTTLVPWSLIGDTYEYWAENRFCLPDVDC